MNDGWRVGSEPLKERRPEQAEDTQFQDRAAPVAGDGRAPAGVDGADKESHRCAHADESKRFSGLHGKEPRNQGRGGGVKAASAHTADDDGEQGDGVIRRERQSDESQSVESEAEAKQFLAADAVGEDAHRIGRDEIRQHQQCDEEGRVRSARQVQPFLDGKIERHERHLIEMRESVQHPDEPERAGLVGGVSSHAMLRRS